MLSKDFSPIIRLAEIRDAYGIAQVHVDSWRTTYAGIVHESYLTNLSHESRAESAKKRIEDFSTDTLVVEIADKIVGFADIGKCREKNVTADGEIYAIYLLKEAQGNGTGKRLFYAMIETAKQRGFDSVFVSVLSRNLPAIEFYKKMGGHPIAPDHVNIEGHDYLTDTFIWTNLHLMNLTLKEGRKIYFEQNGFSEKDYSDRWIKVNIKPIPIYFFNTDARKRAIPIHDLHHVLTGYRTDFLGEAEIGAWELASGCKNYYAAWILNSLAVLLGFTLGPRSVMKAFSRGRHCKNLYGVSISDQLLSRSIGDLQKELGLERETL